MRNLYILGLSLFLGISIPQYFVMNTTADGRGPVRTDAGWVSNIYLKHASNLSSLYIDSLIDIFQFQLKLVWYVYMILSFLQFDDILNTIFSSPPTVAMIVGTLLDNTLESKYAIDDRGVPWWRPFQHRKGDPRNDEFYGLPLRIHEYIPSRFLWAQIVGFCILSVVCTILSISTIFVSWACWVVL